MVRILSRQDLVDFMYGAAIYGTGGGGSVEGAMAQMEDALKEDLEFKLVDPAEVPNDSIVVCPYGVGGGVREEIRKRFSALPRLSRREVVSLGVEALERELGREIYAFVAGELGAGNAFVAMYMAALMGKLAVDGDTVGRSVPEVPHSSFNVFDVPITPFVIASPFGDIMVVTRVLNDARAEDIDRFMAVASGGGVTVIDHPIEGGKLRESIVCGTISKSIEVGRSIREARDSGGDPLEAVLDSTGGYLLFRGIIESAEREGRDGFIWGRTKMKGSGDFSGRNFEVWLKNENLVSWLDGETYVMCPDLITLIDPETADALSNWSGDVKGREVAVIGIKAPEIWRTKRGLDILTPRYFGFDIEYKPIERILEER
jgi:hypothetical protein